jgi:hypothetical protein
MRIYMGAYSAMFTCVKIGPVLMYFIDKGRIGVILGEIKLSDWLELSENRCARANAGAVAAQRISKVGTVQGLLRGYSGSSGELPESIVSRE